MAIDLLLQKALTAAKAGDLEGASELFARLVQEDPSSELGWLGLGICISDHAKREYCFQRVLSINPDNRQAMQALGLLINPISPEPPAALLQMSQVLSSKPTEAVSTPEISQSLADVGTGIKKDELGLNQTGSQKELVQEEIVQEKKDEPGPASLEPIPEEKPGRAVPDHQRMDKSLVIILSVVFIPLIICTAGIAYLYLSGQAFHYLHPTSVPTWTLAHFPTQTATTTSTDTPVATATLATSSNTHVHSYSTTDPRLYAGIFKGRVQIHASEWN